MNQETRFVELWTDYLEGDFDEASMVELRGLLAENASLLKLAADSYQTHRLLGVAGAETATKQDDFVRDTLARIPEDGNEFTSHVMQCLQDSPNTPAPNIASPSDQVPSDQVPSDQVPSDQAPSDQAPVANPAQASRRFGWQTGWFVAAIALSALLISRLQVGDSNETTRVAGVDISIEEVAPAIGGVRFSKIARAQFFGELSPAVQSILPPRRDYVLTEGLVEVLFPKGASAIIEGPAVFRVLSDDALALDVGRCSVHAPDGAEGFRVETPVTRVVDRGTRFAVNVSEAGETAVQVVEGIADVYRRHSDGEPDRDDLANHDADPTFELRLTDQEAKRFVNDREFATRPDVFDPSLYRGQLPDRVVSFSATTDADDRAEHLTSVTVQRNGTAELYPIDDLISSELTWFRAVDDRSVFAHLASDATLGETRKGLLSDTALNTGVINPGGSVTPLNSDPVMKLGTDSDVQPTPGMAVRFRDPVTNGLGPDVVFFELQTFSNPSDGDAFHVSPLEFGGGRKSLTIRAYDLTLTSPEALKLAGFYVHNFDQPVASLADLQSGECVEWRAHLNFHVLAVGIDLSDLGYAEGETVEGLFFQDAMDNGSFVDPVLIAGLPTVKPAGVTGDDQ